MKAGIGFVPEERRTEGLVLSKSVAFNLGLANLRSLVFSPAVPLLSSRRVKEMAERASQVKMTRCEITHVDAERVSRNTGQRHSLGGFVGFAEYEGDLSEFLPYLEIGRYTGVGRQTVWGKGEIHAVVE